MIRVSCPQCGKVFKAPEEQAGRPVVCPRCGELSVAPASAVAGRDEPDRRPPSEKSKPSGAWFLAILHGHATGCPACGRWWSRVVTKQEWVTRAAFDESGAPCERTVDRTTYRCAGCGHSWSVTDAGEYRQPGRGRPQPRGG